MELTALCNKLWKIMRLTTFLICITALHVSAKGYTQKVTIEQKNIPLKLALHEIRKQTGYAIFGDQSILNNAARVNLSLKNATIEEALSQCLKGLAYELDIKDHFIYIRLKKEAEGREPDKVQADPVTGRITDSSGAPLAGATVTIRGRSASAVTDANGNFSIAAVSGETLVVSFVGFRTRQYRLTEKNKAPGSLVIALDRAVEEMDIVSVVSTGYQLIPKERATGSFVMVDKELINRKTGTNILDRLDGIASGVYFRDNSNATPNNSSLNSISRAATGITVRGEISLASATMVSRDPLIVLDNFPYEGNLSNINPNDIESVTILKDAAAASIWGVRAGNGVIVITTKRGKLNQKMRVDVNSNITIAGKPDLKKDPAYLGASDYIDLEKKLFDLNYYTPDLTNTSNFPVLTPVVEILAKQKAGLISQAEADAQINALRGNDVRDEYSRYIYRQAVRQQYSIGLSGGSNNLAYQFSLGYDKNSDNLVRNKYERFTMNTNNTYAVSKRLEISTSVNYSQNVTDANNSLSYNSIAIGNKTGKLYPYAKLADANGNALPVAKEYREAYLDSVQKLGFLDWKYRPLDEIKNSDQALKINDLLVRIGIQYKILKDLSLQVDYQKETQRITNRGLNTQSTYFTRSQINTFTQYDPATKKFTYPFPKGSVLERGNFVWNNNSLRAKLAYNTVFKQNHIISAIAGAEVRELKSEGSGSTVYGYDESIGTTVGLIDYTTFFTTNPNNAGFIPALPGNDSKIVSRFVSFYANGSYSFQNKYILSVSGRKDGSNIFGVSTNQRITPLWSAGIKWNIDHESFYKLSWLPLLAMRFTYGYSGNLYNGTAYTTGSISRNSLGAPVLNNLTAPNPQLRWEKVRTINLGIDLGARNNRVSGSVELFQKNGQDLIQPISLPGSTGFTSFTGNAANSRVQGIDINLTGRLIDQSFRWQPTLLLSFITDKVLQYNVPVTAASLRQAGGGPVQGYPLYALFSYPWAGIDHNTGDPQSILNKTVSTNYSAIANIANPDSMVFHGSALPRCFGSLRNDFSYKGFSLSVNITYKFNYYFRRSSTSLNLTDVVLNKMHQDYLHRWQAPGDELVTDIPSVLFNANNNRTLFYQFSQSLVERGDHIRLSDLRLGYDLPNQLIARAGFQGLRAYVYLNNIGIIWRKNSKDIDPDNYSYDGVDRTPVPMSISFGVQAGF